VYFDKEWTLETKKEMAAVIMKAVRDKLKNENPDMPLVKADDTVIDAAVTAVYKSKIQVPAPTSGPSSCNCSIQ